MLGFFKSIFTDNADSSAPVDSNEAKSFDAVANVADAELRDASRQMAVVEALEVELQNMPPQAQQAVASDLLVARNAIKQGQRVPASTMANLVQARNDQDMRKMLQSAGGAMGIGGGEDVSAGDLFNRGGIFHGLDGLWMVPVVRRQMNPFAGMAA